MYTLSSSHDCIQTQAEGHRHPSGLTRKQSPCTGRCNFLSHFPCMDNNYWSWARQRRQLIMHRYDNHWLIGQHIRGGLDVKAEGTDGGKRNRELHTDGPTQTHVHPFTWRIHTFLVGSVLFISFPPLQHTLHTPQPTCRNKKPPLAFWTGS